MSTVPKVRRARPQPVRLSGVSWKTYTRLLHAFAEHPRICLTYDRGELEIMSPVLQHGRDARFLGRLVVTLTEGIGLPLQCGGSTTFRRRQKQRGLEPDDSYWIADEHQMRGKDTIDLRVDPPPDLAIEADVTSSSLNRMGIYAALGVPEVWRWENLDLTFHILGAGGRYAVSPTSLSFPGLKPTDLPPFLAMRTGMDENAVVRQFRVWL